MDKGTETKNGSDSVNKKRLSNPLPLVKLMPGYRGATVIEGEHGGEMLVGEFFPWKQIYSSDKSMRLVDDNFERLKIDGSSVMVRVIGGSGVVSGLKCRAIKQWIACGIDPIEFETPKQHIRLWYLGAIALLLIFFGCLGILVHDAVVGTSTNQQGITPAMFLAAMSPFILMIAIALWLFWDNRPRKQSFDFVKLMQQGLVGEVDQQSVFFQWDELQSVRTYPGHVLRVRYITESGIRYWVTYPNSIMMYPRLIHAKPEKPRILGANRFFVVQGVRFIVIGLLLGVLSRWVLIQFPNWVPNTQPFPTHLIRNIFWIMFAMPAMLGLLSLSFAPLTVSKVRRRIHALTKRYDRWKQDRAEASTKT